MIKSALALEEVAHVLLIVFALIKLTAFVPDIINSHAQTSLKPTFIPPDLAGSSSNTEMKLGRCFYL